MVLLWAIVFVHVFYVVNVSKLYEKKMNLLCRVQLMLILMLLYVSFGIQASIKNDSSEFVTIAILAKDKAHTLPAYLKCIERQTWPADKTYLYIRTNNNNDETVQILHDWVARVGERYSKIYLPILFSIDILSMFEVCKDLLLLSS